MKTYLEGLTAALSGGKSQAQQRAQFGTINGLPRKQLSSRVSDKGWGRIVAMSKDLDRLDSRRLGRALSQSIQGGSQQ